MRLFIPAVGVWATRPEDLTRRGVKTFQSLVRPGCLGCVCPSLRIVAEWENDSREERPLWVSIESSPRSIALKR